MDEDRILVSDRKESAYIISAHPYKVDSSHSSLYVIGELRAAQLVSVVTIVAAVVIFMIRRFVRKADVKYQDN